MFYQDLNIFFARRARQSPGRESLAVIRDGPQDAYQSTAPYLIAIESSAAV